MWHVPPLGFVICMLKIFHVFTKLITISIQSTGAYFQNHPTQCLEAHPHVSHVSLPRYVACGIENLSYSHKIDCNLC